MSTENASRSYAADAAGVLHVIVDHNPRRAVYVTACEREIDARRAGVSRWAPGVLCARCRDAVAAGVT